MSNDISITLKIYTLTSANTSKKEKVSSLEHSLISEMSENALLKWRNLVPIGALARNYMPDLFNKLRNQSAFNYE